MNPYAASPESLWSTPSFVRFMTYSVVAHVAAVVAVLYGPMFSLRSEIPPDYIVTVNLGMDAPPDPVAPEPEPAPPEPAPPEPPPPEPKPPEPEPPPPKQEVEEAMYVPEVPSEKPKPPKPKTPPKPPEKKPKPQDVTDVMASLRKDVEKRNPAPAKQQGGPIADAELAGYMNAVRACMTINWVGAQQFLRRRDLKVLLLVEVNEAGRVQSVQVDRGSGVDAFDDSAERAVIKCSPSLPPPPSGRSQVVPVTFSPGENE